MIYMSRSLNSLEVLWGFTLGDTESLDYSSHEALISGPKHSSSNPIALPKTNMEVTTVQQMDFCRSDKRASGFVRGGIS